MSEEIYPIFNICSRLTSDPFWQTIFLNLSKGVAPKGVIFTNKTFLYSKIFEFNYNFSIRTNRNGKVVNQDPQSLFQDLTKIFKTKLNYLSELDKKKQKDQLATFYETLKESIGENKSRKRDKHSLLIQNYVIKQKKEKKISGWNNARKLYSKLSQVINLGIITKKDIDINEKGIITDIENVKFEDGDFFLKLPELKQKRRNI